MADSMIERVARAIHDAAWGPNAHLIWGDSERAEAEAQARAAIAEIFADAEILATVAQQSKARREWVSASTWLYPGHSIVCVDWTPKPNEALK